MRFLMRGLPRGARSSIAALSAAARAALRAPFCACGQRSWRRRLRCLDRPRGLASDVAVGAGPMPQVYAPVVSDASHTAGGRGTMVQRLPGGHEIPWRPPATDEIRTGSTRPSGFGRIPGLEQGTAWASAKARPSRSRPQLSSQVIWRHHMKFGQAMVSWKSSGSFWRVCRPSARVARRFFATKKPAAKTHMIQGIPKGFGFGTGAPDGQRAERGGRRHSYGQRR